MKAYRAPMRAYPGLESYVRQTKLPDLGLDMYYYEAGTPGAPALLLLHGLGDEADTWRHLLAPLAQRYHVVAPDLPGFGRSQPFLPNLTLPDGIAPYTIPAFLQASLDLLDVLNIPQAVWIGNSLGAMIAQFAMLQYPERVQALGLIDGGLLTRGTRLTLAAVLDLIPLVGEWRYNQLRRDPQVAYKTLYPYYADLDKLPVADRDFLFERVNQRVWSNSQREAYLTAFRRIAAWVTSRQAEFERLLLISQTPTIILWGEKDALSPVASAFALVEIQPFARLLLVPGGGHVLQQEKPQAVSKALLEWLDSPNS